MLLYYTYILLINFIITMINNIFIMLNVKCLILVNTFNSFNDQISLSIVNANTNVCV